METITFNCRFITPAFLGGANPKGTPELRPPSIKGALRFWWRAQCGIVDLKEMQKKESEIFGGVDGDGATRSSFRLRVYHEEFYTSLKLPDSKTPVRDKPFKVNIFEYLAFGTFDRDNIKKENVLNRSFIVQGQPFQVVFTFSKSEFREEVIMAFYLLSLFGGLGNRNRNGFGGFVFDNHELSTDWFLTLKGLKSGIEKNFNAFSDKIACFQTECTFESPVQALAEIGKAYKNAREYIDVKKHNFTHRSYISSPIVDKKVQTSFLDRHSKPYFMSVVRENDKYRGIILYLPYLFLDGASEIMKELYRVKGQNSNGFWNLKHILIDTPISKHQEYYVDSNGSFHKELCHIDNPCALTQLAI